MKQTSGHQRPNISSSCVKIAPLLSFSNLFACLINPYKYELIFGAQKSVYDCDFMGLCS